MEQTVFINNQKSSAIRYNNDILHRNHMKQKNVQKIFLKLLHQISIVHKQRTYVIYSNNIIFYKYLDSVLVTLRSTI